MGVLAAASVVLGFATFEDPAERADPAIVALDVGIALAFAADWGVRVAAAPRRWRYAWTHAYEMVLFVPFTLVPWVAGGSVLRGARLVRVVRILRVGRAARIAFAAARLRYLRRVFDEAQLAALFGVGLAVVTVSAAVLLYFERGLNPAVATYGEALWWAVSVFTTTAYAAPAPRTREGFLVSSVLMLAGVLYFGVFTASLASALLREPRPAEDDGEDV